MGFILHFFTVFYDQQVHSSQFYNIVKPFGTFNYPHTLHNLFIGKFSLRYYFPMLNICVFIFMHRTKLIKTMFGSYTEGQ